MASTEERHGNIAITGRAYPRERAVPVRLHVKKKLGLYAPRHCGENEKSVVTVDSEKGVGGSWSQSRLRLQTALQTVIRKRGPIPVASCWRKVCSVGLNQMKRCGITKLP